MRKALVALGVLAMVTAAVPASASTQFSEPKEITAYGDVQFGQRVTHNVAGWSSSSTDTLELGNYGRHVIGIYATGNVYDIKLHVNGKEMGYLSPGKTFVEVTAGSASFKYYGKSPGTKSFQVTYSRER
ncbi:hypothetical protein [Brevibacillus laterosporus]|uniref:Secreted protein n=1 Tax=Brevibacillus laterosporus TaxID=1465 RepID=A0AAP3GAL7_BRELA|nr:hypothetical protein [Brevibacillus laterosporus]MCR8982575.1 hypothetical protein [Brevibacillus laterosporus]MCZ0809731.1 hypothetical protein [Brevibacillus laterosporus]MCZ0828325.1 hypothetical protein [Brevibacillus laterosporus]MCZ0851391.1 hypothetical protein [Brevibacillus laterosporus]